MGVLLDRFLDYLCVDCGWHEVNQVANVLQLPSELVAPIAHFFAHHGFIHLSPSQKRMKIDVGIREFIISTAL